MTNSEDSRVREHIRCAEANARLLVNAGPGTGKTEMAALRIANLIQTGTSPGQILVLSFSRSAVRNLTRRLARVGTPDMRVLEELRHVSIRTFDSWTFRMLRLLGHQVPKLLRRGYDENIASLTDSITGSEREMVHKLLGDCRHLIVDEFQDLPGVRGELVLELLDLLAPPELPGTGFTVLGDPAQAIYGFSANFAEQSFPAPADYWDRIKKKYDPDLEELTLTHNYRADRPLARLSSTIRNVLLSSKSDTEKLRLVREVITNLPSPEESVGSSWLNNDEKRSRAILTRTNGEALRVLQKLFGKETEGGTISVQLRAGHHNSLPPAWIAALLSRLKSQQLPRTQFDRIYDHLTKDWGDVTCRSLGLPSETATWWRLCRASGSPENAESLRLPDLRSRMNWPEAFPDDQITAEEGIVVTTIHQSKGLEFDVVTVLDPHQDDKEEDTDGDGTGSPSVLEEAKVHYVAVTRAGREINRLGGKELNQAPKKREFRDNRERLCHWWNGWMNLEMGITGDVDPFGFVDPALHGGTDSVGELQEFLLRNARSLQGHKVMLCKKTNNGKAVWYIHLQDADDKPARLIGRTNPQLTYDLLWILHNRGFILPKRIFNLRISTVGTVSSDTEFPLNDPYRTSRLWLGIGLFGTGDFRTYKRKAGLHARPSS